MYPVGAPKESDWFVTYRVRRWIRLIWEINELKLAQMVTQGVFITW